MTAADPNVIREALDKGMDKCDAVDIPLWSAALAALDALEREMTEARVNFAIERKRANNLAADGRIAALRADLAETLPRDT